VRPARRSLRSPAGGPGRWPWGDAPGRRRGAGGCSPCPPVGVAGGSTLRPHRLRRSWSRPSGAALSLPHIRQRAESGGVSAGHASSAAPACRRLASSGDPCPSAHDLKDVVVPEREGSPAALERDLCVRLVRGDLTERRDPFAPMRAQDAGAGVHADRPRGYALHLHDLLLPPRGGLRSGHTGEDLFEGPLGPAERPDNRSLRSSTGVGFAAIPQA